MRSHTLAQKAVPVLIARQVACQFGEGHFVHAAFEFDHHVQRHPVVIPAPGVEFRMLSSAQVQIPVVTQQLQQKPDLRWSPTSSCSSRTMACSGVSPRSIPPCGNCHEWVRIRLPQNTWFFWLSRMMPTLGRKPSRSSIIKPQFLNCVHYAQQAPRIKRHSP